MTPERFAKGMTFDDYLKFVGSPENLACEGWDIRRFALFKPRVDWSSYLYERQAGARLGDEQVAAIKWLGAPPGGPAKVLVIAEDWSSDCRRDLPYLARLAEAGSLELRLFLRGPETMQRQGLPEPGSCPNADLVHEYANEKKRADVRDDPAGCLLHPRLHRALPLRRVPRDVPQGPRARRPPPSATGRDRGANEGARRP